MNKSIFKVRYGITCLVTCSTILPIDVLVYPLVVLVFPLAVLVCLLVKSVSPLPELVILFVDLFITVHLVREKKQDKISLNLKKKVMIAKLILA